MTAISAWMSTRLTKHLNASMATVRQLNEFLDLTERRFAQLVHERNDLLARVRELEEEVQHLQVRLNAYGKIEKEVRFKPE